MSLLQLPLDIKESRINEKHVRKKQKHNNFKVQQKNRQNQQKVIKTKKKKKIGSFLPEAELGSFGDLKEIN